MTIDVVIPNYNGKHFLKTCLDSLKKQETIASKIIVVDNGSTDGSAAFLDESYPEVETILWASNKGFSAAVNAGIQKGTSPLVFLLNNDTEVDRLCLSKLVEAAESHTECDIFATKMVNFQSRMLLDGAGDAFLRGGVGYRLGTMEPDSSVYNTSKYVFGACAGAALYRRSLFEEIGLFDEDFFAYLEDVDLNLRATGQGKKCWYVSEAIIYHIGSATTGSKINELTVKLTTKNNLNILLKNYPLALLIRYSFYLFLYQFLWFCFVVKKKKAGAYLQGVWEFIKNVPVIFKKRKDTIESIVLPYDELAHRLKVSEKEAVVSIINRRKEMKKSTILFEFYIRLFCN